MKFFNIDSLLQVEDTLEILFDSLTTVTQEIQEGDSSLLEVKSILEEEIIRYNEVRNNINSGKIRIDEVYGIDGQGPILFRDSTTNDSLSLFRFPLDMNHDQLVYSIHIADRVDELGFSYKRILREGDREILMSMYDIRLLTTTYDSVDIRCSTDTCANNETSIYIYF